MIYAVYSWLFKTLVGVAVELLGQVSPAFSPAALKGFLQAPLYSAFHFHSISRFRRFSFTESQNHGMV